MVKIAEKGVLHESVRREKEELLSATPRIDIDRLRFLFDVYKETEVH
jgi:hypothetical protein